MIDIKSYNKKEITYEMLNELGVLFEGSYYDSKMLKGLKTDLSKQQAHFRAFVAYDGDKIVGFVAAIDNYKESFLDVTKDKTPIHIKRFCVNKNYRGKGIGKKLLDEVKKYTFEDLDIPVLYGETNEVVSFGFYTSQGALFYTPRIEYNNLNVSPKNNLKYFKIFTTDKNFINYRYNAPKGLAIAFCRDKETEKQLRKNNFKSYQEIINSY